MSGKVTKPRILVVDDDSGVRFMLTRLLELKGHQVLTADNGAECLKRAKADRPDLIILDVAMPQLGGMGALEQLKRDDSLRHIPVIVITGDMTSNHAQQAGLLGGDDFIQKPFQSEALLLRVQKHLLRLDFASLKALLLNLGNREPGLSAVATAGAGREWHVHVGNYRGVEVRVLVPPGFDARDARALDERSALEGIHVIANMTFSWKRLWPPPREEAAETARTAAVG